jgi:hypothetical protein
LATNQQVDLVIDEYLDPFNRDWSYKRGLFDLNWRMQSIKVRIFD